MAETVFGQIKAEPGGRDALHVGVAWVTPMEIVMPGAKVRLVEGSVTEVSPAGDEPPIGVIDPYLVAAVQPGQWCLLLLWPGQITELRHVWKANAFAETAAEKAEAWLRDYADVVGVSYGRLIEAAHEHLHRQQYERWPDPTIMLDVDVPDGVYRRDGIEQWPLFWQHFNTVTGENVDPKAAGHFVSCNCS